MIFNYVSVDKMYREESAIFLFRYRPEFGVDFFIEVGIFNLFVYMFLVMFFLEHTKGYYF